MDDTRTGGDRSPPVQQRQGRRRGRVRRAAVWVVGIASGVVLLMTLMGFLGSLAWILDLTNMWRLQYAWLSLLLAAGLVALRAWKWALPALAAAAINLALIVPFYIGEPAPAGGGDQPDLRLMLINIRYSSTEYNLTLNLIRQRQPDIVILNEVQGEWLAHLRGLNGQYRLIDTDEQDRFGVLVLTRLAVEEIESVRFSPVWSASIVLHFEVAGRRVTLVGTHAPAPGASAAPPSLRPS